MNESTTFNALKLLLPQGEFRELTDIEEDKINNLVSRFDSLAVYSWVVLSESFELKKQNNISYLALLSINYYQKSVKTPQNEILTTEQELIGVCELRHDYGQVLIRPETLGDKISDLFVHADFDFSFDPDFSKKYYVVASNEERLRLNVTPSFLSVINKFEGLEIEIVGKTLMVRLRKPYSIENGQLIVNFLQGINDGFN